MKIKEDFILRKVADNYVVVAVGDRVKDFNGIINLNETGAFLWELLQKGSEIEDMVKAITAEYEVDEQTAKVGVEKFVAKLTEAKLIK